MSEEREPHDRKDVPLERRSSKLSKQEEVEEEDHSPSSEASDNTLVPTDTPVVRTPGESPESTSPEDQHLPSQRSVESDKSSPTQGNPKAKLLVRSKAVCDDTSPPPDDTNIDGGHYGGTMGTSSGSVSPATVTMATLSVSPTPHRRPKLEKDSSQGSISDNSNSPMLSRDSSMEYTDSTGTDLETFIKMTLNKNRTDRMTLLDLETKMCKFIRDSKQQYFKFPHMSSYHRMLVHRVAAFFGLDHNVDQSGKCVVVNRTNNTRIPDFNFSDHISDDMTDEQPQKQILRRDDRSSASFDESRGSEKMPLSQKSRSLEERQNNYDKVKSRIFNNENSQEGISENSRPRNGSRGSLNKSSRGSTKEDTPWLQETGHKWSSADSSMSSGYGTDSSLKTNHKMTKASSFPGYAHGKSDSRTGSTSGSRLAKADSSSSGTSGLSSPMARPATIPSSPPSEESSGSNQSAASPGLVQGISQSSDGHSPLTIQPSLFEEDGQPLAVWVATSYSQIPSGSLIINKHTQQPYLNKDGSVFRWNPSSMVSTQGPSLGPSGAQQPYPQTPHGPQAASQLPGSMACDSSYQNPYVESQPAPQQQMVPPIVNVPHQHSFESSDIPHHTSTHVLTPQHSTESLPSEPPSAQAQNIYGSMEASGAAHSQAMSHYGLPESSSGHSQQPYGGNPQAQAPPSSQQQQGLMSQAGYLQPPQVPFTPNTSTSGPQIRLVYHQPYQRPPSQGHGQVEGQGLGLGQHLGPSQVNGQYGTGAQNAYQTQFSHMTVQSVETYQQQQYPQGMVAGSAGFPAAEMSATPQQQQQLQQQQDLAANHQGFGGYIASQTPMGHPTPGVVDSQGAYAQVQSFLPVNSASSGPRLMAAFTGGSASSQGGPVHFQGPQAGSMGYRPKSPPSQGPNSSLNSGVISNTATGLAGINMGHSVPNMAVNPQQYVSFAYPNQQGPGPGLRPQGSHQGPTGQGSCIAGPRAAVPAPMWNALNPQAMAGTSAPTQLPMMRAPAVQIGESRYIGQPLQQVGPRPQIQPLFATPQRPRLPTLGGHGGARGGGKGRKFTSKSGRDGGTISPHSSGESTESNDESLACCASLEVFGLPPALRLGDLERYLDDLLKSGATLQYLPTSQDPAAVPLPQNTTSEYTVLATFESESTAARALSSHSLSQLYKLRPFTIRGTPEHNQDLGTITEQLPS